MLKILITFLVISSIFWPFWTSFATGLYGWKLGVKRTTPVVLGSMSLSLISAWLLFFYIIYWKVRIKIKLGLWIPSLAILKTWFFQGVGSHFFSDNLPLEVRIATKGFGFIDWSFLFDYLTAVMLIVVCTISFLVHCYASSYLSNDPHLPRFFSHLSMFTGFMLILISAANFLVFFIGWEGVGICSYLLIGFWYQRIQAVKSALQALVMNKVGDVALLIAIFFLFDRYNTLDFLSLGILMNLDNAVWKWVCFETVEINVSTVVSVCLFVAAVAKSAQIGLHTWLLSAMEGPTPVSALLHAATMVTAGIFLILRCEFILPVDGVVYDLMTIWGATTAFFAAMCGLVQHDIKKVIAFSTCSQLGYMFYACGLHEFHASLYHLTNHAFFKALLFLCAGAVIHALNGEQDLRRMGGLARVMPITYVAMSIASLALIGFPFLSGFYSKDILIELAYCKHSGFSLYAFWLASISAFITAFYSMRLLYWVFLSNPNFYKSNNLHLVEADRVMLWAFRPLIIGSIFSGYLLRDLFMNFDKQSRIGQEGSLYSLKLNQLRLEKSLDAWESPFTFYDIEFLPTWIKLIPVILSILGFVLALVIYTSFNLTLNLVKVQMKPGFVNTLYIFFVKKGFFDIIYNNYIAKNVYRIAWFLYKYGDQGFFEWMGPQGIHYILTTKVKVYWQEVKVTPITLHSTIIFFTRLVLASVFTFILVMLFVF